MTPPRSHRHGRAQQRHVAAAVNAAIPTMRQIEALYRLAADWSPGYSAGLADVKVSGGGNDGSPPPPGTWQPRPSEQLDDAVRALVMACDGLHRLGVDLLARSTDTNPVNRTPGRGQCLVCEIHCEGDGDHDRLRSGMCDACRKRDARLAETRPGWDRQDRIRHMRARLEEPAEPLDGECVPMP